MADGKALELREGARILVESTVYEDLDKDGNGKKLHDANGRKVQTRAEDGQRFVAVKYAYPFPSGFASDPFTGKPASENQTPQAITHALTEWVKEVEQLQANGGKVAIVVNGKTTERTVPVGKLIPTMPEVMIKGFKLEIQGPVNQQMVKDHVTMVGVTAKAKGSKAKGPIDPNALS